MKNVDIKIVILGSLSVGKTCIVHRICSGEFMDTTLPTVGASFYPYPITVNDVKLNIMIWDTSGEERFHTVIPTLLRGSSGVIFVYDITRIDSFQELNFYLNKFKEIIDIESSTGDLPAVLLGNKSDLGINAVPEDDVQRWLNENHITLHHIVSAFTGDGIECAIQQLVDKIVYEQNLPKRMSGLKPLDPLENQRKSCC
ncbi:small GTP-binding protein [Tritrichomonas foetus]|uniref:Small GTP-binding protein n=1 Tax=Tritrichomonas foetus TaxID=1144522 RepID=A0A1J4JGA6_9EUKA|nr:small GTP-binding protein [Tritrichomonas foetus]|eukprot:OHS97689.1 small GTP-binding protein [Tritrichomonas foetus]